MVAKIFLFASYRFLKGIFMTLADSFEGLNMRFVTWAQGQQDVRGLLKVGSRARTRAPADSLSDLDLVIITTNPNRYLTETAWFEYLGEVLLTFIEETAVGQGFERRVLYRGSLDVDFSIVPDDTFRQLIASGFPIAVQDIFRRGFRVLIDKDKMLEKLAVVPEGTPSPPASQDFIQHLNDFLYHAVWTAKKIRRGELWVAKSCCDGYMKRLLLRMMEWHAGTIHGWDYDTWFDGRFLERWADPEVISQLATVFAHYDLDDVKNALLQTVKMHRRLSTETGRRLGYETSEEKYSETLRLMDGYLSH
jgi:aminoglycoside 6-adenylyltransferase